PNKTDELLPASERFPVLPPPHQGAFDPDALSSDSTLRDDSDAYATAHAWFCYAQEPLPAPGELPGSSEPVKDRTRQRPPRNMTTLIFRNYPAQGRRYMAERLQQEGWYDEEPWDVSDWFEQAKDLAGREVKVGGGVKWSENAWKRAKQAWESHGRENHLLFPSAAAEDRMRQLAERFTKRHGLQPGRPAPTREEEMTAEQREEAHASRFLSEYEFYRNLSNFPHHHNRSFVESNPETVACRKLFSRAEQLTLAGSPTQALALYRTPIETAAWRGRKLSPLDAWRELVLLKNKDYRRDSFTQEQTAEYQIRYVLVYNRFDGKTLK